MKMLGMLLAVSILVQPILAHAQETPPQGDREIVPVMTGDAAPKSGLLVPELRFNELIQAEIDLGKTAKDLKAEQALSKSLERVYEKRLAEALKGVPWYEQPTYNRTVGFIAGVVVAGLAIYAGAKLAEAVK
jgi:hypothetical protein